MKFVKVLLLAFGLVLIPARRAHAQPMSTEAMPKVDQAWLDRTVADWPETPRKVATEVMAKYGLPNEGTPNMLVWYNNGPWKRTILYRHEVAHKFPKMHTDLLQQSIDYRVPNDKFDDLAAYDGSVVAERTNGELSARCDKEGANFLALNLANDVIRGRKTVEEARRFYANAIKTFTESGKMAPYMMGLKFDVAKGGTADADKSKIMMNGKAQ